MGSSMPYPDGELEAEVDKALAVLFSGACDECTFEELFTRVGCDPRVVACGRDAVTRVLGSMEAANKVMHRDGCAPALRRWSERVSAFSARPYTPRSLRTLLTACLHPCCAQVDWV